MSINWIICVFWRNKPFYSLFWLKDVKGKKKLKNLPKDAREFIKNIEGLSYSKTISEVKRRWGIEPSKGTLSYYRSRGISTIRSINPAFSKDWEWDWLLGLYYADGTKCIDANYHYTIKFSLQFNEEEMVRRLVDFLNKLGNVKPWVRREGGCIHVLVCSKQLYEILPKKDNPHRPKDELGFLAGLIDGDGSITKRKRKNGYSDVKMIFSQTSYLHLAKIALEIGRKYGDTSLYVIKNPYNPYSDKPEHRVNFHKKTIENLRNTALLKYCIRMNRIFLNRGIIKN
jgi:hypothetical protein